MIVYAAVRGGPSLGGSVDGIDVERQRRQGRRLHQRECEIKRGIELGRRTGIWITLELIDIGHADFRRGRRQEGCDARAVDGTKIGECITVDVAREDVNGVGNAGCDQIHRW